MRISLVSPSCDGSARDLAARLGEPVLACGVPAGPGTRLPPPEGAIVLLASPVSAANRAEALLEECLDAMGTAQAAALVPGEGTAPVLATAAPVYVFDARAAHVAGGMDLSLDARTLGLDTQLRLAGRGGACVRFGSTALATGSAFGVEPYLSAAARNLAPSVFLRHFSPLLAGLAGRARPLAGPGQGRAEPGPPSDPGARTVLEWAAGLGGTAPSREAIDRARRIPDARLPHLAAFVDEAWAASGMRPEERALLEGALSTASSDRPDVVFVARGGDARAMGRVEAIVRELGEDAYWWDPEGPALRRTCRDGWTEEADPATPAPWEASVVYSVGVQVCEIPRVRGSASFLVCDFTACDPMRFLGADRIGREPSGAFQGPRARSLNETLSRADRAIAATANQRDFLLGSMAALHRLDRDTYDEDPTLAGLVALEDGVAQALRAIDLPLRPHDNVHATAEWEEPPFAPGRSRRSLLAGLGGLSLGGLSAKIAARAKGTGR